jgi:hypothetical protein
MKKRSCDVPADKDAIKTEIQAMEDAFAAAYNARNLMRYCIMRMTISFSNEKNPLEGKVAIHESIKKI